MVILSSATLCCRSMSGNSYTLYDQGAHVSRATATAGAIKGREGNAYGCNEEQRATMAELGLTLDTAPRARGGKDVSGISLLSSSPSCRLCVAHFGSTATACKTPAGHRRRVRASETYAHIQSLTLTYEHAQKRITVQLWKDTSPFRRVRYRRMAHCRAHLSTHCTSTPDTHHKSSWSTLPTPSLFSPLHHEPDPPQCSVIAASCRACVSPSSAACIGEAPCGARQQE